MAKYDKGIRESKSSVRKTYTDNPITKTQVTSTPTRSAQTEQTQPSGRLNQLRAEVEGKKIPKNALGVATFPNIPTTNTDYDRIVFIGEEGSQLRDMVFCNTDQTNSLNFSVYISTIDINRLSKSSKTITEINTSIRSSNNTTFLASRSSLAASTSNTLSTVIGGLLSPLVGSNNTFYIYVTKTTSNGELDVTVIR
tara:strand:+ start:115 stop:702 length:588 start_codon:yes stop_codon:yes gene_type:complete